MMVLDGIVDATFEQQMRAASFIADVRELVKDGLRATALVIKNETARGMLELITEFQPLQSQHEIFEAESAASAWLSNLRRSDQAAAQ